MEGETYTTVSRISESIMEGHALSFLHARGTAEGLFVLRVVQKISRSKYLVQDASGKGILDTSQVPASAVSRLIYHIQQKEHKRALVGQTVQVLGRLADQDRSAPGKRRACPDKEELCVVTATDMSLFSYLGALHIMLGEAPKESLPACVTDTITLLGKNRKDG
ncbi:hypothetical protein NECID01_1750 [Nematocida sp. AWRm77]|nr:hypothetical protein NECID01_1750 [Nematocida sp. AWRm77]